MTEVEIRVNAMMAEYRQIISALTDRAVMLASELATAQERIKVLEAEKKEPPA